MTRTFWAYGLAAIAALVTATSSSTACCSSLLVLLRPDDSCCHRAPADDPPRSARCHCCTADNGQPFDSAAAPELAPTMVSLLVVADVPVPTLSARQRAPLRWWQARPPPGPTQTVVLLI